MHDGMRHYPPRAPRRNGSTRAWRTTRAQVLERDGHACQQCGAPATHADHVTPRAYGGSDDATNLQALCADCNLKKGA
jgi:5-methylcytosine-specific restriction endonuclease McrA